MAAAAAIVAVRGRTTSVGYKTKARLVAGASLARSSAATSCSCDIGTTTLWSCKFTSAMAFRRSKSARVELRHGNTMRPGSSSCRFRRSEVIVTALPVVPSTSTPLPASSSRKWRRCTSSNVMKSSAVVGRDGIVLHFTQVVDCSPSTIFFTGSATRGGVLVVMSRNACQKLPSLGRPDDQDACVLRRGSSVQLAPISVSKMLRTDSYSTPALLRPRATPRQLQIFMPSRFSSGSDDVIRGHLP